MVKCKPDYKNLNHIQSFSEQSYATVQWAKQVCQNDEWLRQQVEQLRYLTPPAIRKRYPIKGFFDKSQSYGCKVNGSEVGFDDIGPEKVTVDFNDMSLVNVAKSESVDFVTEEDKTKSDKKPQKKESTKNSNIEEQTQKYGKKPEEKKEKKDEKVEEKVEDKEYEDLSNLTLAELKEKAKSAGIKGYSSMKKQDLVNELTK